MKNGDVAGIVQANGLESQESGFAGRKDEFNAVACRVAEEYLAPAATRNAALAECNRMPLEPASEFRPVLAFERDMIEGQVRADAALVGCGRFGEMKDVQFARIKPVAEGRQRSRTGTEADHRDVEVAQDLHQFALGPNVVVR